MKTNLLATLVAVSVASGALGAPEAATVAKAKSLISGAEAKLINAASVKAVYTEIDEYPGQYRDLRQTGTITLERPDRVRLDIVRARRVNSSDAWKDSGNNTRTVSDGQNKYAIFFHPHSTQVRSAGSSALTKLDEAPLFKPFFGASKGLAGQLESPNIDSVEVSESQVRFAIGPIRRTVEIGRDGLIRRLELLNQTTGVRRTWTLDSVTLNSAIAPSTFQYRVPKDALPFAAGERSAGIGIGSSAPNFEVQTASKRPLRLSELKGKVVVLKFWATWCWPCNQSMPETEQLVAKYRDQGVEGLVVAIKDSRKGFDAWVEKHPQYRSISFAYEDPLHANAEAAFRGPTTPTLYVIDRNGVVVAKFEGFTGPNPEIEKAIQLALKEKP